MDSGWITRRKDGLWMDYKEEGWVVDGLQGGGWVVDGLQ